MTGLTRFVLHHRRLVVVFWLLATVAGMWSAASLNDNLSRVFSFPGKAGYEANAAILRTYGTGGPGNPIVPVITLPAGTTADSPSVRQTLDHAYADLRTTLRLRAVSFGDTGDTGFLSADHTVVFGLVFAPYFGDPNAGGPSIGPDNTALISASLRRGLPPDWTLQVTGLDPLAESISSSHDATLLVETLIAVAGALLILAVVFGSFLALVPLVVAAVSIMTTFLVITGLTAFTDVSFLVQYLVALIGLGIAIDYSLLVVTRWREERSRGASPEDAVHRSMATAGRAVVFSASTVAVGLLTLVFLPVPFLRSVGYGGLVIPLMSTLVSLTLLPVVLHKLGRRLDWPRIRKDATASGIWTRWASAVFDHKWVATSVGLLLILPLVLSAFTMRVGNAPADTLTGTGPAYQGRATLDRAGLPHGIYTPIEVLVPTGTEPVAAASLLSSVDGVYAAVAPAAPAWRADGSALVTVLPRDESSTSAGRATVERVRAAVAARLPGAAVGGSGAQDIDATSAIYSAFPYLLAIIASVTFVLLIRAFHSVLLALQAILLNLLSIGAAYGAMVLVWQNGYGSDLIWGAAPAGAIVSWVPLMAFAFLFGLSMDYEVFLLSRMREEYDLTGSTRTSVVVGLGRVGRLVTGAALILFLTFASLAALPVVGVRIMATGLAAGILLDATILRMLLVPALVAMTGRWTWWVPRWLAKALRMTKPAGPHAESPAGLGRPAAGLPTSSV
jgi:putative drug exporter of the RND superfamily